MKGVMTEFVEDNQLDIVAQWVYIAEQLTEEEKCDMCWRFFAPYTRKRANIIKPDGNCCVNIILKRESLNAFGSNLDFNNNKGYYGRIRNYETYTLDFVIASKEGLNNYNELLPNNVETSRHTTIFEPIRKCIQSNFIRDICNHAPITDWSGHYLYDEEDEIYYGIRLTITQRFYE